MAKEELEKAKQTVSETLAKINAVEAKMAEFQIQYKKLQQMRRNGILFCAKTLKPLDDEGRDLCLEGTSETLNQEIRANMFMFSDLALLDKRDLQKILFKCSIDDLAYSIKLLDNTPEKKPEPPVDNNIFLGTWAWDYGYNQDNFSEERLTLNKDNTFIIQAKFPDGYTEDDKGTYEIVTDSTYGKTLRLHITSWKDNTMQNFDSADVLLSYK